jgi:hypothetical protein
MSVHPEAHTPSAVLDLFVRFVHGAQLAAAVSLYEASAAMVEKPGRIACGETGIRDALRSLIESGVELKYGAGLGASG